MDSKISVAWVTELHGHPEAVTRTLPYALVAILAALLTWYFWRKKRMEKMVSKIPGPPTWPIIGNAHIFLGLDMEGLIQKQLELMAEYGTTIRFWLGPFLWVNISEPRHLEAILTSEFATNKDPTYQFFRDQSNGIFIASGDNWRKLRKIVNPTFHQKLLEKFLDIFNDQSRVLVKTLEHHLDGPAFDVGEHMNKCTLDILCGSQMGVNSHEQTENTSDFAKNLLQSTLIVKKRFFKIHLQPEVLFHMTEYSRQNMKYIEPLHNFVRGIIKERKMMREEDSSLSDLDLLDAAGEKKRPIFLDVMLDQFKGLSDEQLTIKISDMFIAGSDTTGVASSYAVLLMGAYPEVQEKAYKELYEVMGDGDEDFTIATLIRLPYLDMIIKEVLRHYTIPAIVRKLDSDQSIGDSVLPAGTSVQICFYAVHRDPRYWKHPQEFYPEHFLPEEVAKRPKFSYLPFSMGPRNCPGHAFAMMSMKVMVASVLRKYKISSDVNIHTMKYNNVFMLEALDGYPVQLTRR